MRSCEFLASAAVIAASIAIAPPQANADTLTYTGITVRDGAIDGNFLGGQTATVSIEFASGLTALGGVYGLGALTSATYEFSVAGLFTVDAPQDNLEFGSVLGFELSFFDEDFNPLGMLSGTTAGDIGLDPLDGESLPDLFARLGDGSTINFAQSGDFQMLTRAAGSLNGGASIVTLPIAGLAGSSVTLTYVPPPATLAMLGLAGVTARRRRRG